MISEHPADIVLLDYVEGVLEGDESQTVRRHIAGCRACRRTLAEISSAVDELDRLPTAEIPHDAFGAPASRRRARVLARLAPLLLAAAAVVIALIFWKAPPDQKRSSVARRAATPSAVRVPVSLPAQQLKVLRSTLASLHPVAVERLPDEPGFYVLVDEDDFARARARLETLSSDNEPMVPVALVPLPDAPLPELEAAQVR
jgi:anti-sigma factor RsiW